MQWWKKWCKCNIKDLEGKQAALIMCIKKKRKEIRDNNVKREQKQLMSAQQFWLENQNHFGSCFSALCGYMKKKKQTWSPLITQT